MLTRLESEKAKQFDAVTEGHDDTDHQERYERRQDDGPQVHGQILQDGSQKLADGATDVLHRLKDEFGESDRNSLSTDKNKEVYIIEINTRKEVIV